MVKAGRPRTADTAPFAALTRQELQSRALRGAIWTGTAALAGTPVAVVANLLLTRTLGASEYGRFSVVVAALAIGFLVSNLGVSNAVLQWGAAAAATGQQREADSLLRKSLGFHLGVEAPLLLALALFACRDESWPGTVLVCAGLVSSTMASSVVLGATIENRTDVTARIGFLTSGLSAAASVVAAVATHDAFVVWGVRQLAAVLTYPLYLLPLPSHRRWAAVTPSLPRGWPSGFLRYAGFTCAAGLVATLVVSRSEVFLLAWLAPSSAVGMFALAYGLSYQITAPVDGLLTSLAPAVSGLVAGYAEDARRALLRALRFSSLGAGALLVTVLPLVYATMPWLYGRDFLRARDLFVPLAVVSCLQSTCQPITAFVEARRRGGMLLRVNGWSLVLNVAVAIPAIKLLGLWGAVGANCIGQLAVLFLTLRLEVRLQGIRAKEIAQSIAVLPISAIVACTVAFLGRATGVQGPASLLLGGLSALVAATVFVLVLRVGNVALPAEDASALLDGLPGRLRRPARFALSLMGH